MATTPQGEGDRIPASFGCDVLHVGDNAVIVARGDLDLATAPRFEREALATLMLPIKGFTFDLSGVSFLDSSGVHVLLKIHRTAVEHGIRVRFEPIPRQVRKVLELCDLVEFFGLTPAITKPALTRPQTTRTRDVARSHAMHAHQNPDKGFDQWL